MADYFVKKIDICPKCNGARMMQHSAWKAYWEEFSDEKVLTIRTLDFDRKWFEEHGWVTGSRLDIDTNGLPDEMIFCGECEGEGEITSEVDLLLVLPELLTMLSLRQQIADVLNVGAEKGEDIK